MPPAPKPPISRPATRISNDGANAAMSDPPDIVTVINTRIRRVAPPGTPRPATRITNAGANAARSDPPDIVTVINTRIRRVPHLGTSLPVSGIASAEVSAHPARTQGVAPNGRHRHIPN